MSFNTNELNVIRSYIAITGNAPSATEFEAAFDNFAGLQNLLVTLVPSREEETNRQFIESLYANAGLEVNGGVDYWLGELGSMTRAEVAMHFQWAAQEEAAFVAKVDQGVIDRGLEANDSVFKAPSDGGGNGGGEVTPEPNDFRTEIKFTTDQDPYDHLGSSAPVTNPDQTQIAATTPSTSSRPRTACSTWVKMRLMPASRTLLRISPSSWKTSWVQTAVTKVTS